MVNDFMKNTLNTQKLDNQIKTIYKGLRSDNIKISNFKYKVLITEHNLIRIKGKNKICSCIQRCFFMLLKSSSFIEQQILSFIL